MSSQAFDTPPTHSNTAEFFAIRPRTEVANTANAMSPESQQALDLDALMKRYPELAAIRRYIEETEFFETKPAKVAVIQEHHYEGFMRSRAGVLHGALVIANCELLRRFDRPDLGLQSEAASPGAIDSHLRFLVRDAGPTCG